MTNELDFIDEAFPPTPPARPARNRTFDDGLAGATRGQAARATGRKSVARGQYVQLTFRLPEEFLTQISRRAAELGVTQEDMKRWLVWRGLQALDEGERPAVEVEALRRVKLER